MWSKSKDISWQNGYISLIMGSSAIYYLNIMDSHFIPPILKVNTHVILKYALDYWVIHMYDTFFFSITKTMSY